MPRSEGYTLPKMETNTRASYLMILSMARESTHLQTEKSTRETGKMVRETDLESKLGLMGTNMMAVASIVRCME